MYTCPVCGFPGLENPPEDYVICPSCGVEFGYHDHLRSHAQLRHAWVQAGAHWYSGIVERPRGWNPWLQLIEANHAECVPQWADKLVVRADLFAGDVVHGGKGPYRIESKVS